MADHRGRPVRVLHIGNVANNAYLNAKLLAPAGIESDVLSYAHYHVMGSPEWEDSDFSGHVEELHPDWRQVDLRGFRRPEWFAEGPLGTAVAYLAARRRHSASVNWRRRWLSLRRDMICGARWAPVRRLRTSIRAAAPRTDALATAPAADDGVSHPLTERFRRAFPDRRDQLTAADVNGLLRPHRCQIQTLRALFDRYDLVHAYGTEPVLPLLAGSTPFVAFEHGTIRRLPFEDSPIGRLTALAYREASVVIITNADNGRAARRLGVTDFRFVPHPVNEQEPNARAVDALRAELRRQLDADFLLFHPSRQHWAPWRDPHLEKGNDRLIEALARFFHDRPRAAAVFVRWGTTQEASQALLSERGIARRVHWIDPVPGPALARHMAAADVVADQFYLGAFGAITPRALSLGTPPLLHLDLEAHRWALDEPPPVMNACAPDEILALLKRGYDDREWLADLGRRGRAWYARFHSNEVVRRALLDAYAAVLG